MAMGPHTDDIDAIREVFCEGRGLYDRLRVKYPSIHILSMGMSDDYEEAIRCGANIVRVGTGIFGARHYQ